MRWKWSPINLLSSVSIPSIGNLQFLLTIEWVGSEAMPLSMDVIINQSQAASNSNGSGSQTPTEAEADDFAGSN